ncbi:hypothetical protein [Streptomyces sp. LS1784]|uniref:hypothetical protein n=1 Tax=Streptomyces sp. LS1784 TaxID=2851533 RepID=UPI001CCEA2D3|nr:hypothetical protein [Streptomyces sp. LS1784]
MRRTFTINTEPHVAEIGDVELLFRPEVMGDEFPDAYTKLRRTLGVRQPPADPPPRRPLLALGWGSGVQRMWAMPGHREAWPHGLRCRRRRIASGGNGWLMGVDVDIEEMLDRLAAVIGPPPADGVVPVPWELGPQALGFQLPADFRAFADRYGMVSISDELNVYTPSAAPSPETGQPLGFEGFLYFTTEPYGYCAVLAQAYRDGDFDECPYPLFPAEGGLLQWGNNWNSDYFFWLMRGPDPDRWPVAAKFDSRREWDLFEGGPREDLFGA